MSKWEVNVYKVTRKRKNSSEFTLYRNSIKEKETGFCLDGAHGTIKELSKSLLRSLQEEYPIKNAVPRGIHKSRGSLSLVQLFEGKTVELYEPLSHEEMRKLQREILNAVDPSEISY